MTGELVARGRPGRGSGGGPRRAPPVSAWRCRCPCPGTPAWSRRRRSRCRRPRRDAARATATCPPPVGPTRATGADPPCPEELTASPGRLAVGRPASPSRTGIRVRWDGSAVTSSSSPVRWCGAAPVISTSAYEPRRSGSMPGREVHQLALPGAPGHDGAGPSCSGPRPAPPRRDRHGPGGGPALTARRRPAAARSARRRPPESTKRSVMLAASVPGRGLKMKV